jgi:hypothetical protein
LFHAVLTVDDLQLSDQPAVDARAGDPQPAEDFAAVVDELAKTPTVSAAGRPRSKATGGAERPGWTARPSTRPMSSLMRSTTPPITSWTWAAASTGSARFR